MRTKCAFTLPGFLSSEQRKELNDVNEVLDDHNVEPAPKEGKVDNKENINRLFKNDQEKVDILPLGVAAAGGASAYALASSLIGSPDEKRDSLWMRVVKKLIPWGAAGAGAYAGYKFSKKAGAYESWDDVMRNYEKNRDASRFWSDTYKYGGGFAGGGLALKGVYNGAQALRGYIHNRMIEATRIKNWLESHPEYIDPSKSSREMEDYLRGEYKKLRDTSSSLADDIRVGAKDINTERIEYQNALDRFRAEHRFDYDASGGVVRSAAEAELPNDVKAQDKFVDGVKAKGKFFADWRKNIGNKQIELDDVVARRTAADNQAKAIGEYFNGKNKPYSKSPKLFGGKMPNGKVNWSGKAITAPFWIGGGLVTDLLGELASSRAAESAKAWENILARIRNRNKNGKNVAQPQAVKQPQAVTR